MIWLALWVTTLTFRSAALSIEFPTPSCATSNKKINLVVPGKTLE